MKYETWPCLQWHHLRPQQLELKTTSLKLKKESKDIKLEHIWVSRWTICSRVVLWAAGFDKEEDRMEWNKTISLVLLHRFLSLKKKKKNFPSLVWQWYVSAAVTGVLLVPESSALNAGSVWKWSEKMCAVYLCMQCVGAQFEWILDTLDTVRVLEYYGIWGNALWNSDAKDSR